MIWNNLLFCLSGNNSVYSQFTETMYILEWTGSCGPSDRKSSWASHLNSAPCSALLMLTAKVEDSLTGVVIVLVKLSVRIVWLSLNHLTTRFWTGATSAISHCSSNRVPSTSWFTADTLTVGFSIKEKLDTGVTSLCFHIFQCCSINLKCTYGIWWFQVLCCIHELHSVLFCTLLSHSIQTVTMTGR